MGEYGKGRTIEFLRLLVGHQGNACVTWPFSNDGRGYGQFGFEGKTLKAHRMMCELAYGQSPSPEHQAAHSCGRGHLGCVNPKHLSWKTPKENMADSVRHGTARFGKGRVRVKLSQSDYEQIMALKGAKTQQEIATMFGVSWRHIGKLHRGATWKNGAPAKPGFKPGDPRNIGHLKLNARQSA
jgi:hypothetical protein